MRFFEPLIRKDPQYRHGIWFSSPSPSRLIFVEQGQIVSVKGSKEQELFESFLDKTNALPAAQLRYAISKGSSKESFIQTLRNLGFLPKQKLLELQREWVEQLLIEWIQDESITWKFEPVNHASERWGLDISIDRVALASFIIRRSITGLGSSGISIRVLEHQFKHLLVGTLEPLKTILSSHEWITYSQLISAVNRPEELWGLLDYLQIANQIEIQEKVGSSSDKTIADNRRSRPYLHVYGWVILGLALAIAILSVRPRLFTPIESAPPPVVGRNLPIRELDHWTIVINIQADETLLRQIKSDFGEKFSIYFEPSSSGSSTFQVSLGDFASYSEALEVQNSLELSRRSYSNGWGVRKFKDLR